MLNGIKFVYSYTWAFRTISIHTVAVENNEPHKSLFYKCPYWNDLPRYSQPTIGLLSSQKYVSNLLSFNNRTIKILLLWVMWWCYVSLHCSLYLFLWLEGSAWDKRTALLSVALLAINYWCWWMSQYLIWCLDISFWHHASCFLHQHFKIKFC